jgi:hypothetical protein
MGPFGVGYLDGVADQMGHSNRRDERRYVHLVNRQRTEDKLRAALRSAWVGKSLASIDGNGREVTTTAEARKAASLHVFGTDGD